MNSRKQEAQEGASTVGRVDTAAQADKPDEAAQVETVAQADKAATADPVAKADDMGTEGDTDGGTEEGTRPQPSAHRLMSPLNLAFVGDGVYSLLVREYLASKGNMPVARLHQRAVAMVCATAQSQAIEALLPLLTPEEERIYKRGRNAHSASVPRRADPVQYRRATGLEALFGYLYLSGEEARLRELFATAVAACNPLLGPQPGQAEPGFTPGEIPRKCDGNRKTVPQNTG